MFTIIPIDKSNIIWYNIDTVKEREVNGMGKKKKT